LTRLRGVEFVLSRPKPLPSFLSDRRFRWDIELALQILDYSIGFFPRPLSSSSSSTSPFTTTSSKQTPVACWLDTTAATFHKRIVHPLFFTPRSCLILTPSSQIENGILTAYPKIPKFRQNNVRSICQSVCILTVTLVQFVCLMFCVVLSVLCDEKMLLHYLKKKYLEQFSVFKKRCTRTKHNNFTSNRSRVGTWRTPMTIQ
jgi:hypothetical protein